MSTLHGSKGLEWPCVFVMAAEEGILPISFSLLEKDKLQEERRLLYVGMTRPQCFLYVTFASGRYLKGKFANRDPCRFLDIYHLQADPKRPTSNLGIWSSRPSKIGKSLLDGLAMFLGRLPLSSHFFPIEAPIQSLYPLRTLPVIEAVPEPDMEDEEDADDLLAEEMLSDKNFLLAEEMLENSQSQ